MKKNISFILNILLGILYGWSGMISAWLLIPTSVSLNVMNLVFELTGVVILFFTIIYFIWKRKGYIPIIGIIFGFLLGYFLLVLGLGLGNT